MRFILIHKKKQTPMYEELIGRGIDVQYIPYRSKKDLLMCFFRLLSMLIKWKPNIIHAHLFEASLLGLLAGKIVGVKKRIYTRHHSSLHLEYFPRAVWYDRMINYCATDIVSISKKVSQLMIEDENVSPDKIHLIYHGFPFKDFEAISEQRINSIKLMYRLTAKRPVIGVISRFIHWKGIQYIIPAFAELLKDYESAVLVLANARGEFEAEIDKIISEHHIPSEAIVKIPFEDDIMALYQCFDVFVHAPINDRIEAFGQTYIEALLSKVPLVCTKSGIANEIISNKNAQVVSFKNAQEITSSITKILQEETVRENLFLGASNTDLSNFTIDKYIDNLEKLYRG